MHNLNLLTQSLTQLRQAEENLRELTIEQAIDLNEAINRISDLIQELKLKDIAHDFVPAASFANLEANYPQYQLGDRVRVIDSTKPWQQWSEYKIVGLKHNDLNEPHDDWSIPTEWFYALRSVENNELIWLEEQQICLSCLAYSIVFEEVF